MNGLCTSGTSAELLFTIMLIVTVAGFGAFFPACIVPLTARFAFVLACLILFSLPSFATVSGISLSTLFVTGVGASGTTVDSLSAAGEKSCIANMVKAVGVGAVLGIVLSLPAYVSSLISAWSVRFCRNSAPSTSGNSVAYTNRRFLSSLRGVFAFLYLGTFIVILPDVMGMMATTVGSLMAPSANGQPALSMPGVMPVVDGIIGGTVRIAVLTGTLAALPILASILVVELFSILAARLFPAGIQRDIAGAVRIGAVMVALMLSLSSTEYLFRLTSGEVARSSIGNVVSKTFGGI